MAIQKRFIHFKKFEDFNSKKLSANEANTQYTVGVSGAVQTGSPDILYQSYCWIKDTKQQWTHGQLYNGSVESDPTFKSSAASGITTSDITNWNNKTSNTGTVTSITPGVGLTNGDGETAITTTGTVNLKLASNSEIGGIKITNVADKTMATTAAKKYWPVNVTTAGVAYVGLPNFTTNSGDITGVTAGNGLTGGATSGTATLNVGAGTGISVKADAVSVKINNTDSLGTIGTTSKLYAVGVDANGELAVNVPWTDNNTTYGVVSTSANGLAPKVTDTSKFLKGDGTWATPTNTTYSSMTGASSSAAGKAGLVPAPAAGKQASFLRGDGTWVVPTNTTYSNMTGARASAAGKAGLVPAPAAGKQTSFLRGDGTWAIPTNTTYSAGSGLTLSSTTFNVGAGTGISVANDAIGIKTAQTSEIGGIKIGKDNSSYEVTTQTSSLTANATSGKYYAVEIDKNDKAFVYVPWTDNNTTSFTITASASDDDVVVLSGTNGTNKVTYSASHAKKGPSSGYTSGNTTTSISGSAARGTISIPQITVDSYGHVTAAADENITITMPTIPTSLKNPKSLTVGSKTYNGASAVTITAEDLGLSSALKYCGVTTTKLKDGDTTNPIAINSANFTATAGSVVFYGSSEFVFDGRKWAELGDGSNHKIKQDAVSSPSASGNATAFIDTISQDANGKITVTKKNVSFPTETSLSGGSAAAANATVVGGVTVSGHKVTVGKKTITGSGLASVSGTTSGISINVANPSFGNITSNPFIVDSSGNISAGSKTITAGDFATSSHTLSKKADKSTTLSGYGITNAYTKTETDNKFVTKTNPTGSGYVSFGRVSNSTIGTNSVVIGTNSKATNTNSIAVGTDCTASGENSTVIGTGGTASGLKAISLGDHNTASGEYAFATGCWTNSNGIAGITLGNGSSTHANSWASMSSGIITEARGLAQHVFGSYNIPDTAVDSYSTPAEHLLIVGNGDVLSDASYQSNAMTLDWDGNAWFSGDVYVGSTSGTNKDSGSVKLAKASTTLSGYGITNAYTKTESNNRYLGGSRSAYDIDTRYNAGIWMTAGGTNIPSGIGDPYGVVLTLPYRQMSGNNKPDFGCQIFMPNGDDRSNPNSLYFRTALSDTWNPWQQVATTSMIPTESVISGWGFTKNAGTVTAIKINGTTKSPSNGVIDLGTIQSGGLSSESDPVFKASAAASITTSDISNWNKKTSNTGTITGIKMNGASKGTSGVVDLGTVLTAHQPIKTINGESLIGSGNITISGGSSGSSASSNSYTLDWSTATKGDPSEMGEAMLYPYTLPITSALSAELCSKDSLILYNTNPNFLWDALMESSAEQFIMSDKSVLTNEDGSETVMFSGYRTSYASTIMGLLGEKMVTMQCFATINPDTVEIVFILTYDSGSSSGGKELVTTTSTTIAMNPNKYYRQTSTNLQTLTITLNSPSNSSILNEYLIEFTTASSTTVALPTGIKWSNGQTPIFEPNCTYQISIVNNLGVVTKFL